MDAGTDLEATQPNQAGSTPRYAAVVLAGGRGIRLGGVDKAGVEIGGRTLLERALDMHLDAVEVVVVGEPVPAERPVTFTREDPAFGGPVAGACAGVAALLPVAVGERTGTPAPSWLVVTAVDQALLTPLTVRRLLAAGSDHDGAVLVDDEGRRHPVLAVRRDRFAVLAPSAEDAHGMAWRALLDRFALVEVPAHDGEGSDVDTELDLLRIREAEADAGDDAGRGLNPG